MPKHVLALLLTLPTLCGSERVQAVEVVPVEPQDFEISEFQAFQRQAVIVDEPIELRLSGMLGAGIRWVVPARRWADTRRMTLRDREYALLPVDVYRGGRLDRDGDGFCGKDPEAYVAVDTATGAVLNKGVWRFPCAGQWSFYGTIKPEAEGSLRVELFHTQAEADAALAAELPQKKQVGASVCHDDSGIELQGYTEAVSPDNGKIQVRISRAVSVSERRPPSVSERLVWDDPNSWRLCDAR